MKKKIILTLLLCFILVSCGKKGNPKYEDSKKKVKIETAIINKA
ncbi:hypothetical protein OAN08_00720 [Candidatus Pelagibacter sp.]|jgi:hypothetical protein|nr:hypothetical protein [Candidatus Pelagibacter sp.]